MIEQLNDFDQARALILSYVLEGEADDLQMPEILRTIREVCGHEQFNKLMLLLFVMKHHREEFDAAGFADAAEVLRDFQTTADMRFDGERFLLLIHLANYRLKQEAISAAWEDHIQQAGAADPVFRAAMRFVQKFGNGGTIKQALSELTL